MFDFLSALKIQSFVVIAKTGDLSTTLLGSIAMDSILGDTNQKKKSRNKQINKEKAIFQCTLMSGSVN